MSETTPGPEQVQKIIAAAWRFYGWPVLVAVALVSACAATIFVAGSMYERFTSLEGRVQSMQITLGQVARRIGVPPDHAIEGVPANVAEPRE